MLGSVSVNAVNLGQGEFPTVEKYFLFVGECATNQGEILRLNTESNLATELGSATSVLKTHVSAAKANAGEGWACAAMPLADSSQWVTAVDTAMMNDVRVEAIVICRAITDSEELAYMQTKADEINAQYGRRVFFMATTVPIDAGEQTWSDYINNLTTLVADVNGLRITITPDLFEGCLGMYAGRLCNNSTSVADTPMRVNTGALSGITADNFPRDSAGIIYNNAHAAALNDQRFAVPQTYADYPGVFWSDGQTLDAPTGDYTVIENLRVVDKAARAVRLVLIGILGNRMFNSSQVGEDWAISKLMRPLYEMSKSYTFQGITFPAELESPEDGDIAVQWVTRTQVNIFMVARPFEIAKEITANIVLDLSAPITA